VKKQGGNSSGVGKHKVHITGNKRGVFTLELGEAVKNTKGLTISMPRGLDSNTKLWNTPKKF
jgi:hypothetical protein